MQDVRLGAQHPGHTRQRHQHQKALEALLAVVKNEERAFSAVGVVRRIFLILEEEHVDQANQEARCTAGLERGEVDPLVEDETDQVPEHAQEEENLWDEFAKDVDESPEEPERKNKNIFAKHLTFPSMSIFETNFN